ncbi:unnamed protein product [Peronospora farinosa]|uniref:HAT C-terminal dimerisation domain-containing protein n=2 Tax=Peronospora farinosa TaxID=134698 RepID=A0AAV0T6N2_9STRA|nr:unnamed protein product [Peronospora farinosa]CAI5715910.1 unnamed protein product [Peronospora farinosa]
METNRTFPPPLLNAPRRPRGRPPSRSWAFFTTIVEPQKQPSAVCRHCNQLVYHRQKWGQARSHLMKCPQFLRLMETIPSTEVPEWYFAETCRRQNVGNRNKTMAIPSFQNQISTQSVLAFDMTMVNGDHMAMETGDHMAINNGYSINLVELEKNVAMHLFTTIAMEKLFVEKMEFPFLLQAVQACNRDFVLPTQEKIMTELLDRCFESVKERVDDFFKTGLVPVTLSLEAVATSSSKKDWVVRYMASLEKCPMYLESVNVLCSEEQRVDVEWSVRDVARVVEKLSCPVAGCVIPCSSLASQRTRELLEKQFPAMYFYGCMRDALWSLVQDIFTDNDATDKECSISVPFTQDFQQFALECKDLEFFLPIQANKINLGETIGSSINVMHVTARRRLSIKEAFTAILQAEPFLDADNVLNQLFLSGSNEASYDESRYPTEIEHLQNQLAKILRNPQFEVKLRKFLDVLRPIYRLLELLGDGTDATSLLISEVHSSFSRLAQQFASSTLLQSEEKETLQQLVRHHQENVLGSAHVLANLLDPVLLGENLPVDTMENAEQKLMSSLRVDGTCLSETDKEALYAQYMDFKKFALNQKTNKAETRDFRTLKERKKSPLQFWFADGAKWPVLQAIACHIFVMPVCAASSTRVISDAGVALHPICQKTSFSADKLVYVRVNTHQLHVAEVAGSSLVTEAQKPQRKSIANDITASMVV